MPPAFSQWPPAVVAREPAQSDDDRGRTGCLANGKDTEHPISVDHRLTFSHRDPTMTFRIFAAHGVDGLNCSDRFSVFPDRGAAFVTGNEKVRNSPSINNRPGVNLKPGVRRDLDQVDFCPDRLEADGSSNATYLALTALRHPPSHSPKPVRECLWVNYQEVKSHGSC